MKKTKIIGGISVAMILVMLIGLAGYIRFVLPKVGEPENIKVETTPEKIARGRYLANHVYACMDCHSTRDWKKFTGPVMDGTLGGGGEEFNQKTGFPGEFYAKNITPFALGSWTDGEILRAISCGVSKSGRALFPVMPYLNYGKTDLNDLFAMIAYLRSLETVKNVVRESKPDFPMNMIINFMPKKAAYSKIPDTKDAAAYGAYLLNAASCADCHTRQVKGKAVQGMALAGGFEFPLITGGTVRSANITPDKETGIGGWREDTFTDQFRMYANPTYVPNVVAPGDYNTMMPWLMYGYMNIDDLKAIYAYLRSVEPVKNEVVKFTPVGGVTSEK